MTIDLRSDTVTQPTSAMKEAMLAAPIGDDVFGEDPSINALEQKTAAMFGMDQGLFCPSGTMTNQIALNVLSQPYEEVLCYQGSHVYRYEGGGAAGTSGLSFRLLEGKEGQVLPDEVLANINPDDQHFPVSSVLSLENTVNKAGGTVYTEQAIKELSALALEKGLKRHLDGARIFNALRVTGQTTESLGKYFDTISICLSKGLGAPVGSLLLSKNSFSKRARRMRKVLGGGMRQAGFLAAAGSYALDQHIVRLDEDHVRAKKIGTILSACNFVSKVIPPVTNIVIFEVAEGIDDGIFLQDMASVGILGVSFGKNLIRLVTHLDFDDTQLTLLEERLKGLQK